MLIISTICKVDSKRYKFTDYDTILLVKQLANRHSNNKGQNTGVNSHRRKTKPPRNACMQLHKRINTKLPPFIFI